MEVMVYGNGESRKQFDKLKELRNQNDNLAASNIHLREENRELEEEIEQLKKRLN